MDDLKFNTTSLTQKGYIFAALKAVGWGFGIMFAITFFMAAFEPSAPAEGVLAFCIIPILWLNAQMFNLMAKRLRGLGHSPWWCLIIIVPYIGLSCLIGLMFFSDTAETTKTKTEAKPTETSIDQDTLDQIRAIIREEAGNGPVGETK